MLAQCTVLYLLLCTSVQPAYTLSQLKIKHNINGIGKPGAMRFYESVGVDAEIETKITIQFFLADDDIVYSNYYTNDNIKDAGKCVAYGTVYQAFYYYSPLKEKRS